MTGAPRCAPAWSPNNCRRRLPAPFMGGPLWQQRICFQAEPQKSLRRCHNHAERIFVAASLPERTEQQEIPRWQRRGLRHGGAAKAHAAARTIGAAAISSLAALVSAMVMY